MSVGATRLEARSLLPSDCVVKAGHSGQAGATRRGADGPQDDRDRARGVLISRRWLKITQRPSVWARDPYNESVGSWHLRVSDRCRLVVIRDQTLSRNLLWRVLPPSRRLRTSQRSDALADSSMSSCPWSDEALSTAMNFVNSFRSSASAASVRVRSVRRPLSPA